MSKKLIAMDNELIRSSYVLDVSELKLIYTALSKLDSSKQIEPRTAIYITKNDYVQLGTNPKNIVREVRYACEKLMKRTLVINTKIGDLYTHWMHHVWLLKSDDLTDLMNNYEDAKKLLRPNIAHQKMVLDILKELKTCDENLVARIEFHDDILPFLSALQSHFTQLRLDDLKNLSTFYSHRFYHLMMQFNSTGVCKLSLMELRKILLLEDKYSQTKDLRKWVIEPAIKEIREKTSFFIEHKLIKTGQRYTYLELKFKQKKTIEIKKAKAISSDAIELSEAQISKYSSILSRINDISDLSTFPTYDAFALWIANILRDPKSVRDETAKRIFKALRTHTDFKK